MAHLLQIKRFYKELNRYDDADKDICFVFILSMYTQMLGNQIYNSNISQMVVRHRVSDLETFY